MAPLSSDRGDFDAVTDINLLIEAVRVKLQRAKLNLRNSVEKWRRDSAIEGQHCNLREKGDSFFLKKDFNKALHCVWCARSALRESWVQVSNRLKSEKRGSLFSAELFLSSSSSSDFATLE